MSFLYGKCIGEQIRVYKGILFKMQDVQERLQGRYVAAFLYPNAPR
ncbi:hypothetical protein TPHV1_120050 [Treponema phagedenis]|uniref:Uncharacterized protein n=1 Tax=Treponema phagedenis TaxID=162 RepID=A0A0B7GWA0_TREPH|nr:hypothetical protein TPHV1_120050 [Treponema phagedenis]